MSRHSLKFALFYEHTRMSRAHLHLFFPRPSFTNHSLMKVLLHVTAMQDSSRLNRKNFHLPDGPKWRAHDMHDNAMRRADHHARSDGSRGQVNPASNIFGILNK